jgi:phosphoglycerate dehydrogenase-like enzyme
VRAVFLDYETVSNGELDTSGLTRAMPELQFHGSTHDAQITGRIDDAEIVLLNKFALTRDHLFAAKRLKLIALAATGTHNVDLAAARDPDIPNLLLTPHVAWAAREARQRCLDEIAANVQDLLSGGRRNRVV